MNNKEKIFNDSVHIPYEYYYDFFKSQNISFSYPCQDRCSKCSEHDLVDRNDGQIECAEVCVDYNTHVRNANSARKAMVNAL